MRGKVAWESGPNVRLRDVAERVGVSVNTASFVLNGSRSGTRVSDQTRNAILAAAHELGYSPNEVARSLRRKRTNCIGLFIEFESLTPANLFFSDLLGGVQEECCNAGITLLLHSSPPRESVEDFYVRFADRRVDGLLFYAPAHPALAGELAKLPIPVVAVVDRVGELPSVTVDDFEGGRLQAEYLASTGRRRVIYRGFTPCPISAVERKEGFLSGCKSLGLEVPLVRELASYGDVGFSPDEVCWLESGADAVVCWEDNTAHLSALLLDSLGFRVPADVEVVGFNGTTTSQRPQWTIPTVVAPWRDVARRAVRVLLGMIEGQPTDSVITLPVSFCADPYERPAPTI